MRKIFVVISLLVFCGSAIAFPEMSSLESTISVVSLNGPKGKKVYLGPNKARQMPAGYSGATRYSYRFYQVQGTAPLIFLHVGLGGKPQSGAAEYMASMLHQQGYHVVVLGSTFTSEFATLAASTPYVGQARVDAYDLYVQMIKIKRQLAQKNVLVSKWGLVGYSFGALVSAFVTQLDDREGYFNFSKVVLINPPIDLADSLYRLDQNYSSFAKLKRGQRADLALRFAKYGLEMLGQPFNPDRHLQELRRARITQPELRALIGADFRQTLQEVVFISQQMEDVGIIPMTPFDRRKARAEKYSYTDYVSQFMTGFFEETLLGKQTWNRFYRGSQPFSLRQLNRYNSLQGAESTLRKNKRIVLFHNLDDFLMSEPGLAFLRRTLGSRLILFPKGGHLGNFWYPPFQRKFLEQWQLAFQ